MLTHFLMCCSSHDPLKILVVLSVASYLCVTVYFIFCPFWGKSINSIFIHNLHNLTDARNYYTILSSISTITTGFFGLLLGYLYFVKRNEYDAKTSLANRTRDRIRFIIDELNKYDELVYEILSCSCLTDTDLQRTRNKVERLFDKTEVLLESNEKLLSLQIDEIKSIVSINSFVEQAPEIMEFDLNLLKATDLSEIKLIYIERVKEARSILFQKTENI